MITKTKILHEQEVQKVRMERGYKAIRCYLTREQASCAVRDLNDGQNGLERVANLVTATAIKYGVSFG